MRRQHPAFVLAAALGLAPASAVAAAGAGTPDSLGLLAVADLAPPPGRVPRIVPLSLPSPFTLRLDGAGALDDAGDAVATGRFTAALDLRRHEPTPARLEAAVLGSSNGLRGEFRVLAGRARGLWAGVAVEGDGSGKTSQTLDSGQTLPKARPLLWKARPLLGLGAWARRRSVMLGASVSQIEAIQTTRHVDVVDSLRFERVEDEQVLRTAGRASLRWARRAVEIEAGGGLVLGDAAPWRWADARLTFWPLRPLAIVATASSPAPVLFDSPATASHRASLGFRLDPWRVAAERPVPAPTLECRFLRTSPGWHAVEVRARGARSVELMGDFTDWTPRRLQQVSAQRWRLEVALAPGAHRLALRVDGGEWRPPPGLPTAADEFGGTVGLLVVR